MRADTNVNNECVVMVIKDCDRLIKPGGVKAVALFVFVIYAERHVDMVDTQPHPVDRC